jgi:hypothetical protein
MGMTDRLILCLGSMFVVSGCTVAVKEAQMQDRAQMQEIAKKNVDTAQNNGAHVKRIAFIGLETPNQVRDNSGGGFSMGGKIGAIQGAVESAERYSEMNIACRALDLSFDNFTKALTDAGFELVPFEEQLKQPQFALFVNAPLPEWCYAAKAPARMNFINPFAWKDTFRVVQQLIDAIGVDGIVMGQLGVNERKSGQSTLSLYVKGPDGVARVGWMGQVGNGDLEYEAAQPGEGSLVKQANAVRVFTNTFQLLATKMGMEAK